MKNEPTLEQKEAAAYWLRTTFQFSLADAYMTVGYFPDQIVKLHREHKKIASDVRYILYFIKAIKGDSNYDN